MDLEQYIDRFLQDLVVINFNSVGVCIFGDGKYFVFICRGYSLILDAFN